MNVTTNQFNEDAYNTMASLYEEKRKNPSQSGWNRFLEGPAIDSILKPIVKDKTVLDLGCGTGLLTEKLIQWKASPQGVDQSENMIEIARKNLPQVKFQVGAAEHLPYEDNGFEIVGSSLMMHYIQDLESVFREVARVLKQGGEFVFSMHHPFQESFKNDGEQWDEKPLLQPYFHNNAYYWEMCGVRLMSFHHTFECIVTNLSSAGFLIKGLKECTPHKEAEGAFEGYGFTSQYPTFCVIHAIKV